MVDQFVVALHVPLSRIRLERYRSPDGPNLHMLANYFWNMNLAKALFPALHAVEVALRNTVHTTLTNRYRTQEWWRQPYALGRNQLDTITKIEVDYQRDHGKAITPGRLVAALSFGFWTTILSQPYESRLWRYKNYILIDQAFPHRGNVPRHDIHQRFNDIRLLRNRVMHHEAIYDRPHLLHEHANIHQAIRWISEELHQGIHVVDDFQEVYRIGWERAYARLHGRLGGP